MVRWPVPSVLLVQRCSPSTSISARCLTIHSRRYVRTAPAYRSPTAPSPESCARTCSSTLRIRNGCSRRSPVCWSRAGRHGERGPRFSPWGGHAIAPLHYLGPERGLWVWDRVFGPPKGPNLPFRNLWPTHVGRMIRHAASLPNVRLVDVKPRYYPSQRWIVRIPGLREIGCGTASRARACRIGRPASIDQATRISRCSRASATARSGPSFHGAVPPGGVHQRTRRVRARHPFRELLGRTRRPRPPPVRLGRPSLARGPDGLLHPCGQRLPGLDRHPEHRTLGVGTTAARRLPGRRWAGHGAGHPGLHAEDRLAARPRRAHLHVQPADDAVSVSMGFSRTTRWPRGSSWHSLGGSAARSPGAGQPSPHSRRSLSGP